MEVLNRRPDELCFFKELFYVIDNYLCNICKYNNNKVTRSLFSSTELAFGFPLGRLEVRGSARGQSLGGSLALKLKHKTWFLGNKPEN